MEFREIAGEQSLYRAVVNSNRASQQFLDLSSGCYIDGQNKKFKINIYVQLLKFF